MHVFYSVRHDYVVWVIVRCALVSSGTDCMLSTNGRESLPMAGIRRSFSNATPPCSFLGIRKLHCSVERDERNVPRVPMHKLYFQPPEKPEETRHTCKHDEASALHLLTQHLHLDSKMSKTFMNRSPVRR